MKRIPRGMALLPRRKLHRKLRQDIQLWLDNGHHITRLPPGRAQGLCRYDTLGDIMLETGLRCEY